MEEQPTSALFDAIGERYEAAFTQRSAQLAAGEWIIEQTGGRGRALDLGCGGGWPTAMQLANAGLDVVGVDESERMLERARDRVPSGDFRRADLRALPPDLGRFDAVVAFFSLMMLPRADIPGVLDTVRKLLRPGGLFVMSMLEGDLDSVEVPFLWLPLRISAYPRDELRQLLTAHGYVVHALDSVVTAEGGHSPATQLYVRATTKGHATLTNIRPVQL